MQKILITGGSRGIGFETAKLFLENGFETIVCARGEEGLEQAKAQLPGLVTYPCDISDKQSVKALVQRIKEEHGVLDILYNNGGVFVPGQVHQEEDSVFENLMATNLNSAYYLTKGLLPDMIARKKGTVVNMCSIASLTAYDNGGSYSISKYALLGFSKVLREEMKPHGIRVISLMPGATFTSSWEGAGVEEDRLMPAEDIARLIWTVCDLNTRTVVEDIVIRPQLGDL